MALYYYVIKNNTTKTLIEPYYIFHPALSQMGQLRHSPHDTKVVLCNIRPNATPPPPPGMYM